MYIDKQLVYLGCLKLQFAVKLGYQYSVLLIARISGLHNGIGCRLSVDVIGDFS